MKTRLRKSQTKARKRPVSVRKSRRRVARRPGARELENALKGLRASVEMTRGRAEAVLSASDLIAKAAVAKRTDELVDALAADGVLGALDRMVGDSPKTALAPVRFREVVLGWLRREFNLEPVHEPGEILEIPRAALAQMSVEQMDDSDASLVRVQVVQSGWTVRRRIVARPVVTCAPAIAGSRTT